MPIAPTLHQPTLAGGEISPATYGRVDLARYQNSLRTCKNAFVKPEGGVCKRAGTRFVAEVKDHSKKVRLVEFIFATGTQEYVLEFGDQYVRVIRSDGLVLNTAQNITAITAANPGVVTITGHGLSNGDQVFIDGIVGMTELNQRQFKVANVTTDTLTLQSIGGADIDTTGLTAYTSGGTASTIFEVATTYLETELSELRFEQSGDVLYIAHPDHEPATLSRTTDTNWTLEDIDFTPNITAPFGSSGNYVDDDNADVSIGSEKRTERYVFTSFDDINGDESIASAVTEVERNDPFEAGNKVRLTINRVTAGVGTVAATDYNIYKEIAGVFGYAGTVEDPGGAGSTVTFDDVNITPTSTDTPPVFNEPFANGNNPGTVAFYQDRLMFAGSDDAPQTFYGSRTGNYDSHLTSEPPVASDSIEFTVTAREVNRIHNMLPLKDDLILFTTGSIWAVSGQGERVPITPDAPFVRPQQYYGADPIEPLPIGDSAIFVEVKNNAVRDLYYETAALGYVSNDISIMSRHLFDDFTITDWAYARAPDSVIWVTRSDGALLGLTYQREHQISAWHQHATTNGEFESVAGGGDTSRDVPYFVVKRTIGGNTVRYIELMEDRAFTDQEDAFFVDCGLRYDGAAVGTFGGLWHLEGQEVCVLADGNVFPAQTVSGGKITLPGGATASKVAIGLPFTGEIETLEMNAQTDRGPLRKQRTKTGRIFMQVNRTRGLFIAHAEGQLEELKERQNENYSDPIALQSGLIEIVPQTEWARNNARIRLTSPDPLPFEILSIMPEIAAGG